MITWPLSRRLVEQVNLKAYVQATRHLAYVLIDSLLALHRKGKELLMSVCSFLAFKDLGAEFLNSYTKLVDGEKDPRNLMLLFSMDRVILLEFEIADHIDVSIARFDQLNDRTSLISRFATSRSCSSHRQTIHMVSPLRI